MIELLTTMAVMGLVMMAVPSSQDEEGDEPSAEEIAAVEAELDALNAAEYLDDEYYDGGDQDDVDDPGDAEDAWEYEQGYQDETLFMPPPSQGWRLRLTAKPQSLRG